MEQLYQILILPIISILDWIFMFTASLIGSYGWSIILLALIVKIILFPVGIYAEQLKKQELSLQYRIQPQIKEIKKQYKGEDLHNKLTDFYKKINYHPIYALKTSLGLFIQIPFFIAAFLYFGEHSELNQVSFYLVRNLAEPDGALLLGETKINLLPVLMTLISVGATYLYGLRYQGMQTKGLYIIAIVFLVLLYNQPSSLLLYWTTNNIFSFIESLINNTRL